MATTYYNDLQKLYVAYFNRPADTAGLAYYEGVLESTKGDAAAVKATLATISASFAASAEYQAAYSGKTNAEIVNTVYLNLFGRAAEQAGKDYWAGLLDSKKITINEVVTQVAGGAQGSDLTAFNNKVAASVAFTAALSTTNAYSGDNANAVAKLFLSGITDNASFATATDTYALGATVAKVNAAGTTFSLQSGLAALDVANAAHTNFLDAFDGKADGKVTKTDLDVTGAVSTAATKVAGLVDAALPTAEQNLYGSSSTSAAVKAALLTEAQANLAAKLTTDQGSLGDANTAIAKVPGLTDALAQLTAAKTALDAAAKADTAAAIDLAAKLGAYNAQNTVQVSVADNGTVSYNTTDSTGAVVSTKLIVLSSGKLALATGVTETTNPGITALLASSTAKEAADATVTSASTAQTTAQATVDALDLTTAAQADLKLVANAMTIVKLDAGVLPTSAQITTELSSLQAVYTSNKAISDANPSDTAAATATTNAKTAYDNFSALVNKFHADDTVTVTAADGTTTTVNSNPLIEKQAALTVAVSNDQKAVDALTTALSDLAKANVAKAQLDAITGQIKAAGDAFVSANLVKPITVDATHADLLATAGSDIYVAGTVNAKIANFGLLGSDALYIGTKYTTLGTDLSKGDPAVLEAFVTKDAGGNAVVTLEQKAYGSNSGTDLVTITLTGVTDVTKVHLANGIITVS